MTVPYSREAATASSLSLFRMLILWKGSIWKLVFKEVLGWTVFVALLAVVYPLLIKGSSAEESYKSIIMYINNVPIKSQLTLMIGFITSIFMNRWMEMYKLLTWPDSFAQQFNVFFNSDAVPPSEAVLIRRTVYRYLTASYVLLLRDVSAPIRKRFHSYEKVNLTKEEIRLMKKGAPSESACLYWIPLLWITLTMKKYYTPQHLRGNCEACATSKGKDCKMKNCKGKQRHAFDEHAFKKLVNGVARFRAELGDILAYDWVPMPLALAQLVIIMVYITIIFEAFAVQSVYFKTSTPEQIPYLALAFRAVEGILLNAIYLGLLKCAQVILNPFGEDDDDFEVAWLLDRHRVVLNSIITQDTPMPKHNASAATRLQKVRMPHTLASLMSGNHGVEHMAGSMAQPGQHQQ